MMKTTADTLPNILMIRFICVVSSCLRPRHWSAVNVPIVISPWPRPPHDVIPRPHSAPSLSRNSPVEVIGADRTLYQHNRYSIIPLTGQHAGACEAYRSPATYSQCTI